LAQLLWTMQCGATTATETCQGMCDCLGIVSMPNARSLACSTVGAGWGCYAPRDVGEPGTLERRIFLQARCKNPWYYMQLSSAECCSGASE